MNPIKKRMAFLIGASGVGKTAVAQLLEGQRCPSFIIRALEEEPTLEPVMILLDCRPGVRQYRREHLRRQDELVGPRMDTWAAYLRGQADALGIGVIDTTDIGIDEAAARVEAVGSRGFSDAWGPQ